MDQSGTRLGKGGGCYDRALGRVPVGTFTCTLLYEDELVDAVPADAHDRRVGAVVTPAGRHPPFAGMRVSVSLVAASTCLRANGQASVLPSTQRSVWST